MDWMKRASTAGNNNPERDQVNRILQLMELARTEDDPEFTIVLNNSGLSLAYIKNIQKLRRFIEER